MRANLYLVALIIALVVAPLPAPRAQPNPSPELIRIGAFSFDPLALGIALPGLPILDLDDPFKTERWIIPLKRAPRRAQREMLMSDYGLTLVDYVPRHGYIERVSRETLEALSHLDLVLLPRPYQSSWKLRSDLVVAGAVAFRGDLTGGLQVSVSLFDDADPVKTRAGLKPDVDCKVQIVPQTATPGLLCPLDPDDFIDTLRAIVQRDEVRSVEQFLQPDTPDALTLSPATANPFPGLDAATRNGLHGENQIVAINDIGPIDVGHCWFEDPTAIPGPDHRKVRGIIGSTEEGLSDHATFMAGVVAGSPVNDLPPSGFAREARLVSVSGDDPMAQRLSAAASFDATIHNNSWSLSHGHGYGEVSAAVDRFTWMDEDQLVIAASGNNGDELAPPGTAKNAITVSAARGQSEVCDGADGPTEDERHKPDLVAPGDQITSAVLSSNKCRLGAMDCYSSVATAATSAAAALVRQYFIEGRYPTGRDPGVSCQNCKPSGALIKATLLNATTDIPDQGSYPGDRDGWGLIDPGGTLSFPDSPRQFWATDVRHADGLDTGEFWRYPLQVVSGAESFKVTLVWSEPPGLANADDPVVNDLNLIVVDPSNRVYRGNHLANGSSAEGGGPDHRNNVEQVVRPKPETGVWTIEVKASEVHVAYPGQGFAVVASGGWPVSEAASRMDPGTGQESFRGGPSQPPPQKRKMGRRWAEGRFLGDLGWDSNPTLDESEERSDGFAGWAGSGELRYSRFRHATSHRWDRAFDLGGELALGGTQFRDTTSSDPLGLSARFYAEGAPWRITSSNAGSIKRGKYRLRGKEGLSFGALYRFSDIRLGSSPFLQSQRLVLPAIAYSFSRSAECDLSRLTGFVSIDRINDRRNPSGSASNRDGDFIAGGVRYSLSQTPLERQVCMGGGIFRDPLLYDYWTTRVEAQYGHQGTDGSEFDRDVLAFVAAGSVPVLRTKKLVRLLFDGELQYSRSDHSSASAPASVARADDWWNLDVGLVYLLKRQSSPPRGVPPSKYTDIRLRLGVARSDRYSNVPGLDYSRTVIGLTFDILYGAWKQTGPWKALKIPHTPSPGSNIDPTGGPELPEIVTDP